MMIVGKVCFHTADIESVVIPSSKGHNSVLCGNGDGREDDTIVIQASELRHLIHCAKGAECRAATLETELQRALHNLDTVRYSC